MTQDIDDDDRVTASGSSNAEEDGEEKGKVFTEVSIQVLYCTVLYCTVLSIKAGEPAIKMVRFSLEKENSSVRGSSYKSRLKSKVSRYICRYLVLLKDVLLKLNHSSRHHYSCFTLTV